MACFSSVIHQRYPEFLVFSGKRLKFLLAYGFDEINVGVIELLQLLQGVISLFGEVFFVNRTLPRRQRAGQDAVLADFQYNRTRIRARNAANALFFQQNVEALARSVMERRRARLAYHDPVSPNLVFKAFKRVVGNAVIPDEGVSKRENLAGVGRIRKGFLKAGHGRGENQLASAVALGA